MKNSRRVAFLAVVATTLAPALSPLAPAQAQEKLRYKGVTKCKAMQVEVAFTYDRQTSTLRDFRSSDMCALRGISGRLDWTPIPAIPVAKDGTFLLKEHPSGLLKGRVAPSGEIVGEFGPYYPGVRPICADEKTYPKCTTWKASPAK